MIDVTEIRKLIPHRYPFLLVDRIVELEPDRRIVGIKNVSINESFFQGHFPDKPIMPGVLICEAMAQVGAIFARCSDQLSDKVFVLTGLDRVKFKHPVEPGDQLRIELEILRRRKHYWRLGAHATVDGKRVAEAELSAMEMPV
ncbi:MAG: 3-hydroxyacyl-ACP dehydratase FabZ [Deltaproteobacteria bacterium]|nr:3-hydroxyacyl-ACP dehydratase FabZ [Deltaproteobacteria bacterium]